MLIRGHCAPLISSFVFLGRHFTGHLRPQWRSTACLRCEKNSYLPLWTRRGHRTWEQELPVDVHLALLAVGATRSLDHALRYQILFCFTCSGSSAGQIDWLWCILANGSVVFYITFSINVSILNPGFVFFLDFPGGLGYPAELHPGCWTVPRPGGHPHLVSTARPAQTHDHKVLPEPALPRQAPRPPQGAEWGGYRQRRCGRQWIQRGGVAFRLRGPRVKWGRSWGDLPVHRGEWWEHRGA